MDFGGTDDSDAELAERRTNRRGIIKHDLISQLELTQIEKRAKLFSFQLAICFHVASGTRNDLVNAETILEKKFKIREAAIEELGLQDAARIETA